MSTTKAHLESQKETNTNGMPILCKTFPCVLYGLILPTTIWGKCYDSHFYSL